MKRVTLAALFAGVLGLMVAGSARADQAEQVKRDAERLGRIKKIALVPVVIQLRFDRDDRLPDPNRMVARLAAATRIAPMLEEQTKSGKYPFLPPEAATLALKEMGWQPTDLYVTNNKGSLDTPAETLRNKKGDEAALLNGRAQMKQIGEDVTVYRYRWHNLPEVIVGLAAFREGHLARIDADKAKALAAKLGADALLFCQVADLETHEGSTLVSKFKSTRVRLHATLFAPEDGAIVWQARARGVKSQQEGVFTRERAYTGEDRKAIESASQAIAMLLDDLNNGTGKPAK